MGPSIWKQFHGGFTAFAADWLLCLHLQSHCRLSSLCHGPTKCPVAHSAPSCTTLTNISHLKRASHIVLLFYFLVFIYCSHNEIKAHSWRYYVMPCWPWGSHFPPDMDKQSPSCIPIKEPLFVSLFWKTWDYSWEYLFHPCLAHLAQEETLKGTCCPWP